MNTLRMFLNYIESSNILVILTVLLIVVVTYLLLSSDLSIFSEESSVYVPKKSADNSSENLNREEKVNNSENKPETQYKVEMKGFQLNEMKKENDGFVLGNKTENVEHLSQKINNINNKNDEMGLMFIEGLSSLNSWKNEELGDEILKKIEWNLEKRENDEDGVIYQYVYPHIKKSNISNIITTTNSNMNLASSQESINSLTETEDGEEEKEKQILSSYKLGICKIFENEKNVKSNIVKEINDKFYKVYSEGEPEHMKTLCKRETIPDNYDEIIAKNKTEGNEIMSICGKKVKMNYLQCQRYERQKCESNMVFLGFVFYKKTIAGGYNPGYS